MTKTIGLTVCTMPLVVLMTAGCPSQPNRFFLEDEQGRQMILHGLNISNHAKRQLDGMSWHALEDYERMLDWGFNAIRLLIFWARIMPEEGIIDHAYVDRVEERVSWAADNGLYVILDMHQDLYGYKFGGDGAPAWATRDDGHPFERVEPWWMNYLSRAVMASFDHLWNDADLQQHYFDAWAEIADRFASNPTVIGYDLMNEPFFGFTWPSSFEARKLLPFYQGLTNAIRARDPDAVIYFEPMIITSSGMPSKLPPFDDSNAVYFPHFYQLAVHEGSPYNGNPWLIRTTKLSRSQEAERHGVPWLLGEFGVADSTENFDHYLHDLLRVLDEMSSGWTYWSYDKGGGFSILDSDGHEKPNLFPLIRTYPQKVAGSINEFSYDASTRVFELTFEERGGVVGPTEIFVPSARVYGGSFVVTSSDPEGSWSYTFDPVREILSLLADPGSSSHAVRIEPETEEKIQALERTVLLTDQYVKR